MEIQIQPKTFLISALSGSQAVGFSVHPATRTLVARTQIPIEEMAGVSTVRPYLQLVLNGGSESIVTVVRFQTIKDDVVIHKVAMDRRFWGELVLQPTEVPDLRSYQAQKRWIGNWNVTADIAFFSTRLYQSVAPASFEAIKNGLRFQRLVEFKFEVVSNETTIELTATGRLAVDRDEINTTYTLNDL